MSLHTRILAVAAMLLACFVSHGAEPVTGGTTNTNTVVVENITATNSAAAKETVDTDELLRRVLILQEQLRSTQHEVQAARHEAEAAATRTGDLLTERLNFIEIKQFEAMQNSNHLMLIVVGAIAAIACIAVLLSGWLQMKAVTRLSEISQQLQMLPALAAPPVHHQLGNGEVIQPTAVVQAASEALSGNVDRLQRRLDELEQTANGKTLPGRKELPVSSVAAQSATIIAKGQSLLNLDKPGEALPCFEEAISVDARNIEAWIKKGTALERLGRIDDAIAAYDKAIEVDESTATAYLFKAGVFNRQKRYAEALQCYEKALNVQKTRGVSNGAA